MFQHLKLVWKGRANSGRTGAGPARCILLTGAAIGEGVLTAPLLVTSPACTPKGPWARGLVFPEAWRGCVPMRRQGTLGPTEETNGKGTISGTHYDDRQHTGLPVRR